MTEEEKKNEYYKRLDDFVQAANHEKIMSNKHCENKDHPELVGAVAAVKHTLKRLNEIADQL